MPVTRIKNNQITDATINAAAKVTSYSITSGLLANSLTYGSDLTITGNLTVNGSSTTIDTVDLIVEDPIIILAANQTGSPSVDIGFIGKRGTSTNVAFVWDESVGAFLTAFTNTAATNTAITISSYADFQAANITANTNLAVTGTTSLTGNVTLGNLFVGSSKTINVGNNIITNVATPVGNSDAATKEYVDGIASSGFTIEDDTANTTVVSSGDTLELFGTANEVTVSITATDQVTFGLPDDVTVTATLTAGNLATGGTANVTGNITGGNVATGGRVSATGNVIGGNLITAGLLSATGAITSGSTISATGNVTGGNVLTGGLVSATGNVGGGNLISAALVQGVTVSASGNVVAGNANITSAVNSTTVSATGNVTGGNINTAGLVSATGAVIGGSLSTAGTVSATGNITGGNLITAGLATVTGNVNTSAGVSATGNVTGGNINTAGLITATGNITGGNLISGVVTNTAAMTISTASGNLNLQPTGNIVLNSKYINGLNQPVQDNDAASKIYVDNMVSTQLAYHTAVVAATTGTLAAATGGTITYNNGTAGVGATLTVAGGTFNLIDTANVQTVGTRILVKNQVDATQNGVYEYTSTTVITRTSDADTYGPNSATDFSINDYFFVSSGDVNKGSAWIVDAPSGVITFGTSNIAFAQFSSSQTYTANTSAGLVLNSTTFSAKVDNNTTAFDGGGNISVKAGANLTTPNIGAATGTSLSVTGNVTGGNLNTGAQVVATGNITGGNLITAGLATVTGNVNTSAGVSATGNVTGGNINTGAQVVATGNITGGNIITGGLITATGTITSTANVAGGNLTTSAQVSAGGNITGGNLITAGLATVTGNITGGNLITAGLATVTGNITGGNINTGAQVVATGNITGGNLITAGLATVTGNVNTSAGVLATGNITGGNINTGAQVVATGNITGGNLNTGAQVVATGNITGGNINTGAQVVATGNITGGNITTAGQANLGNIRISGDTITGTNGRVNINSAAADVDFSVSGTAANVFYIDAGTSSASFGNATQVTNVIAAFQTTTSIKLPVGTTGQRPATGVTGMMRFNTSINNLEFYDNDSWETAGSTFTVITANTQSGNGVQTAFTLPSASTTAGTIVAINGVVQIPVTAYSISNVTCTFTEAPLSSDVIDFRILATTSTVSGIAGSGGGILEANPTLSDFDLTGNIIPTANITYNLGNTTNRFKDLYLSGSSLYLGNVIMKTATGNSIAFFQPDGTTPATIAASSVDTTQIASGTSSMAVIASGGNIRANIAGTTVQTISAGLVAITGDLSVSGNATLSGNILGDRVQNGTTSFDIQTASGNANVSVGGTSNVAVFATTGAFVTGVVSASGNVTGGNLSGTSIVGTLTTAAQTNITSVGTLGSLAVSGNASSGTAAADTNTTQLATTAFVIGQASAVTPTAIAATGAVGTSLRYARADHTHEGVTSVTASTGISTSAADGAITLTNTGVTSIVAGTNISVSGATGAVTVNVTGTVPTATTAGTVTTAAQANITSVGTLTSLAVTGNITSGNLQGTSIVGTLTTAAQTNITSVGALNAGSITSGFGAIDIGTDNITVGGIINANANGVGNIGSSSVFFNTVFAKATSAQYADLAEKYVADAEYAPGTVLAFGGDQEVTLSTEAGSTRVAGVVSTNPSYIMNAGLTGEHVAMVALQGRVPCRVVGPVRKGDMMVAAGNGAAQVDNLARAGTIIGKALENFDGAEGTIEVVIGRN